MAIEQNASAPAGWGMDSETGQFAKLPEQQNPSIVMPQAPNGPGTVTSGDNSIASAIQGFQGNQTTLNNLISQIPQIEAPTIAPLNLSGLQSALNAPTDLGQDAALQESKKLIEERQGVLGQRAETRKGEITKSAEEQKAEIEVKNYQQKELTRAQLARIGISEINSTQAVQYLNDLQLEQNKSLVTLYNNTQTLLNQVENDYADGNFELAGMWVDALKDAQTRQDDLMKFRVQTQIQLAELSLKQQQFAVQTGLDYANYSLNQIKTAVDAIGEGNRGQEANAQIALEAMKEEREAKASELSLVQKTADSLAPHLLDSTDEEIKQLAKDYGISPDVLLSSVAKIKQEKEQETAKLTEEQRQFDLTHQLSQDKFDEDKRQFGADYALKQQELSIDAAKALGTTEGSSALKDNALVSSKQLLEKFIAGQGTSVVGKLGKVASAFSWLVGGTEAENFKVQLKNLKSLLSLDNVQYIKGQGQISNKEREILESASAKLDLTQSEPEFQRSLERINASLMSAEDLATQDNYKYTEAIKEGYTDDQIKEHLLKNYE